MHCNAACDHYTFMVSLIRLLISPLATTVLHLSFPSGPFDINPSTGEIFLTEPLNYETRKNFTLIVQVIPEKHNLRETSCVPFTY